MSTPEANLRRRVVEKKSPAGAITELRAAADDSAIGMGNDFSHTIKGETLVDRSKDLVRLRKNLAPAATISPRRKKSVLSHRKPKWETVLSILAKNILLLAVLLWLGKVAWMSTESDRAQEPINSPFMSSEYDGRVSEVAASLKETAAKFQLQLEVLDRKIRSGFENVRREVLENVEEKRDLFEKDLKRLEARVELMDESLGDLKDMGLVSREEFENFWNELKSSRSMERGGQDVDLDTIRAFARSIVEEEIEKHSADGLGRADYALASAGARVVKHSKAYSFRKHESWFAAFKSLSAVHANAHKMLEPSFGEPGQCFALEGSTGYVEIKLKTAIIPQAITLEHVSKAMSKEGISDWLEKAIEEFHMKRASEEWKKIEAKKAKASPSSTEDVKPHSSTEETNKKSLSSPNDPKQIGGTKTFRPTGPILPPRPTGLTFAKTAVKDWYNTQLANANQEEYNSINGIFRAIQTGDVRTANYHLSQIEKMLISKNEQLKIKDHGYHKARSFVENMTKYFSTSRSSALTRKLDVLFEEKNAEQRQLKTILDTMEPKDLIKLRNQDFLDLVQFFKIDNEKIQMVKSECQFQKLLDMYSQQLIDDQALLQFFKKLEDTDIEQALQSEELILNKNSRPRLMACFETIPTYEKQIKKGLVHEIYLNTKNPEQFEPYIPKICSKTVLQYGTKFQSTFMFRIWSIWEERQYIRLFPSFQLWELYRVTEEPQHKVVKFNKKDFVEENERRKAAEEFMDETWQNSLLAKEVKEDKNILLYDWISTSQQSSSDKLNIITRIMESLNLGRIGSEARENFLLKSEFLPEASLATMAASEDSEMMASLAIDD